LCNQNISADEAKTQTYCQVSDIAKQIVQAGQQKDNKKAEELADELTEQEKKLGPGTDLQWMGGKKP
jgi:hypothetical protein